ncbi:MAG: hypothetical protein NVS1B12_08890 [Acidimicrobiales bacterium]
MAAKCPVCEKEFVDVDTLRRHTADDHGLSGTGAGGKAQVGSWAPVAGPGPEGWYADPWNAKFQRWWDGKQWSGRTAPAGTHTIGPASSEGGEDTGARGPERAPLRVVPDPSKVSGADLLEQARASRPQPRPAPIPAATATWADEDDGFDQFRRPSRRVPPTVAIAGALLGALLLVGGVVYLAVGGSGGSSGPGGLPAVVTNPGQTRLASGVAGLADLGLGWTAYPPPHALTPAVFKVGPCGSALWSSDVGGYEDAFINGNKTTSAHGAVVSQVREAASAASAEKQRQFVMSPDFIPCLKQTVSQEISSQFPPGSGERVGPITVSPLSITLPVPSQAFILTAGVIEADGRAGNTITNESVQLFSGPYKATVDVSWCSCAPLTQQVVEKVATAMALRITALPPQGTLGP